MNVFETIKDMRMLLIDDDKWVRDSLRLFFEGEGCTLQTLETAEEGIDALKGHDYDIIITDYRLPGMSGLNFLKTIQGYTQHAIKILITAYKSPDVITEALTAGIDDFIEKPFTTDTIEASLARSIARHDH